MAQFTMELEQVIELTGGTVERSNGQTRLIGGNIGLAFYPIFQEEYRDSLTGKIVDHFWNCEIGVESIGKFQLLMRRRMNEIMPLYNKLYLSEQIEFDPMGTVDLKTVTAGESARNAESSGDSTAESVAAGKSRSVQSETPQTMLRPNADYATAAADANSENTSLSTGNQNGAENETANSNSESRTTGYQGIGSELLMRYRESLLNIDLFVIRDLEDCFMGVWGTSDSYTTRNGY